VDRDITSDTSRYNISITMSFTDILALFSVRIIL